MVALVNAVGNVASGRLLQRGVRPNLLLATGFCAMALGSVVAFAGWDATGGADSLLLVRYLGVVLFSMVGGLIPGTLFSLAVRLAPDEGSISTTVGWMQQLSALGQFVGPPVVAWVASQAGGWQWTWVVTGGCSVLGLLVAHRIGREVGRATN
jgi:MFS transporter, CP family, cyanate transporter